MSRDQAFAFAYDEIERLLRDPSIWVSVAAYVALFKVAHDHGVVLRVDDPFDQDVRNELAVVFEGVESEAAIAMVAPDILGGFECDFELVRRIYLI